MEEHDVTEGCCSSTGHPGTLGPVGCSVVELSRYSHDKVQWPIQDLLQAFREFDRYLATDSGIIGYANTPRTLRGHLDDLLTRARTINHEMMLEGPKPYMQGSTGAKE